MKLWKRLFTKYIDENLDLGGYSDVQGELILRKEIAKYLKDSRAVNCNENQIIIGCGFSDSMGVVDRFSKKLNIQFLQWKILVTMLQKMYLKTMVLI